MVNRWLPVAFRTLLLAFSLPFFAATRVRMLAPRVGEWAIVLDTAELAAVTVIVPPTTAVPAPPVAVW